VKFENGGEPTATLRNPPMDAASFTINCVLCNRSEYYLFRFGLNPRRTKVPGQWASDAEVGRKTITL
jgi:hypothetical protein